MNGQAIVYEMLNQLNISFDYYEHPPVPTVDDARKYWKDIEATHCKNLFFRNHKGNQHYLVIFDCNKILDIHTIEKYLAKGKLSFASEERMKKHLGISPGSVSPFGLLNDPLHHVYLFLDDDLKKNEKISFHPNLNTASLVIRFADFMKYLEYVKNPYEFLKM